LRLTGDPLVPSGPQQVGQNSMPTHLYDIRILGVLQSYPKQKITNAKTQTIGKLDPSGSGIAKNFFITLHDIDKNHFTLLELQL